MAPKHPPKHRGLGGIHTVEELVEPAPPNPDLLSSFFPTKIEKDFNIHGTIFFLKNFFSEILLLLIIQFSY